VTVNDAASKEVETSAQIIASQVLRTKTYGWGYWPAWVPADQNQACWPEI